MRIILSGPHVAATEQVSVRLSDHYSLPIISILEMMQQEVENNTAAGMFVKPFLESGKACPEELVMTVLGRRLGADDCVGGYILHGFPRTQSQLKGLEKWLESVDDRIDAVIYVEKDVDELMQQLVGCCRCGECGEQYNIYENPPTVEGVCDLCGGRIRRRPGGTEEAIATRLRNHEVEIAPVLALYEKDGRCLKVSGDGSDEQLFERIREALDSAVQARQSSVEDEKLMKRAATG